MASWQVTAVSFRDYTLFLEESSQARLKEVKVVQYHEVSRIPNNQPLSLSPQNEVNSDQVRSWPYQAPSPQAFEFTSTSWSSMHSTTEVGGHHGEGVCGSRLVSPGERGDDELTVWGFEGVKNVWILKTNGQLKYTCQSFLLISWFSCLVFVLFLNFAWKTLEEITLRCWKLKPSSLLLRLQDFLTTADERLQHLQSLDVQKVSACFLF